MAREPKIAYVLLRNAQEIPGRGSRPPVETLRSRSDSSQPTSALDPGRLPGRWTSRSIVSRSQRIPNNPIGGNLAKAWGVARLLRRRGVDLAIIENHLPAAAFIASASGVPAILHSYAYVKGPSGALDGVVRGLELRRLSGLVFVSEVCTDRFRAHFPAVRAPIGRVPNGLDMTDWSYKAPKERVDHSPSAARSGGKGHLAAMRGYCARSSARGPEWKARFILSDAAPTPTGSLRPVQEASRSPPKFSAAGSGSTSNLPFAEVKAAWEGAAVGIVLTTGPEPFGRTALEALASGTALVTSGLGGLAEVCGECAVTVDPSDADRVAAVLGGLMDALERRADLARAGRKRVETLFDIRAVARQMDDFIEACVGDRRSRA